MRHFLHYLDPDIRKIIKRLERLLLKIWKRKHFVVFNKTCFDNDLLPKYTMHTYIYIYIYIYIYLKVNQWIREFFEKFKFFLSKYYVFNWFIGKITLILEENSFWSYSKWQIKESAPTLNRGLSSDFWWLRSANHVKFTECMMHMEEHVLEEKKCL